MQGNLEALVRLARDGGVDYVYIALPLAGGRALKTPFGVFFSPNITPDKTTGIGRWSDADFVRAFRVELEQRLLGKPGRRGTGCAPCGKDSLRSR